MPAFPTGDELNLGELDPGARPPMLLRRSRLLRWLVLGLAMILAPFVGALSAIAYLSDGPVYDELAALWTDDANGRCDVDALVGYWTVRTLALDSHGAPASQGAGALDMTILPADRCAVDIEVRRLANGEEQLFGADVPRGSARFTVAEVALVGPSATGAITLRGPGGAAAETYSLVVSGDELYGAWSVTAEGALHAGRRGALRGIKGGTPGDAPTGLSEQPCAIQCALRCGASAPRPKIEACKQRCGDAPWAAVASCEAP